MLKQINFNIFKIASRQLTTTIPTCRSAKVNLYNMNFDRRVKVDYKTSIKYMDSEAYKETYKDNLVWKLYKRNHKALFASDNTRLSCVNKDGFVSTSYPCPICRDEYLVIHPENRKLIEQFVNPNTGEVLLPRYHGLCKRQYRNLIISIEQAKDKGYLPFEIPDRLYDYKEYYGEEVDEGK